MTEAADPGLFADVRVKLKRGRALLFDEGSACLQDLLARVSAQDRLCQTRWALAAAEPVAARLNAAHPGEKRPLACLRLSQAWARGEIPMPEARPAILAVHALAKDLADPADAAEAHALGQACSAIHSPRHAKGLIFYELTALVLRQGPDFESAISEQIARYHALLTAVLAQEDPGPWAAFLLREPPARRAR